MIKIKTRGIKNINISTTPKYVFNFSRKGLTAYLTTLPQSLRFEFPQNSIVDMDIKNSIELSSKLEEFFTENKFKFGECSILISDDLIFQKEFASLAEGQETEIKESFLSRIPLDDMVIKVFKNSTQTEIFALSRNIYEFIMDFLEERAFKILQMVSEPTASKVFNNIQGDELYAKICSTPETLKPFDILESRESHAFEAKETKIVKKVGMRAAVGILVFIFLLLILAVVVYVNIIRPTQTPPSIALNNDQNNIVTKQVTNDIKQTTQSTQSTQSKGFGATKIPEQALSKDQISVSIVYKDVNIGVARDLSRELLKQGYSNVDLKLSKTVTESKVVNVSANLPSKSLDELKINLDIAKFTPTKFVTDTTLPKTDIIITY